MSTVSKNENEESPDKEVATWYKKYRGPFLTYFKKYDFPQEEIIDAFQDSIVALYRAYRKGGFDPKKSSLKTYLFAIGKNKMRDLRNKKMREDKLLQNINISEIAEYNQELTVEQKLMQAGFRKLGDSCKTLLTLFYYRGLSMSEIVDKTNYKDTNSVKAQKSRCLKRLRELVKEK